MNSLTFYNFYMDIWNKYQGWTRDCFAELIENLIDLGYNKLYSDESWLDENPILPATYEFTNSIYEYF